jgi:hypothetical protein
VTGFDKLVFNPDAITIISGGQTGADRAALDFAIDYGLLHGGWCPRGRRAEDGPIGPEYELQQTPSHRYAQRTAWNIRDSDATVVFSIGRETIGGSRLTLELANQMGKPALHLSRDAADDVVGENSSHAAIARASDLLRSFLAHHNVRRLNVAGPRASQEPEVGQFVRDVLRAAFNLDC